MKIRLSKTILLLLIFFYPLFSLTFQNFTINKISFKSNDNMEIEQTQNYNFLITCKKGDLFSYKKIKKSMQNLYKIGCFSNIEVKVEKLPEKKLNLYFVLTKKFKIKNISIQNNSSFSKKDILKAIFSIRKDTYFENSNIKKALNEIKKFLISRGYFNPEIKYKTKKNKVKSFINISFFIKKGKITKINKINLKINNKKIYNEVMEYINMNEYIPYIFQEKMEKIKNILKKKKYYFPEIKFNEEFLNVSKSLVNLNIDIHTGYKYSFRFKGMKDKMKLISSIWEKEVFENWAEKESQARILIFLKKRGYLNAKVDSKIEIKNSTKIITFFIDKKNKYSLGKIEFRGNKSISTTELRKVIRSDNLFFDKFFWIRPDSLQIDLELLKLLYYYRGFPQTRITMKPEYLKKKANINFTISEGERLTVDSILFEGNKYFNSNELLSILKTKKNGPFVQQKLNEDIIRLKDFYYSFGFIDVAIDTKISSGKNKLVLITISEGTSFKMGDLIIIEASNDQAKLLKKLFPIKKNSFFNKNKIDTFENEIENSSIFNKINIVKIKEKSDIINILLKITPDKSKSYGFGFGWEERTGVRCTFEYQKKNIFKSYSSVSSIFQLGLHEQRGLLSYDTTYFFKTRLNSSFKIWKEYEIYPSYKFDRAGIGETIIKELTSNSYILTSLGWYRTKLTDLKIQEQGLDRIYEPFDTTALSLSYVIENRDDPFNPTEGDFFSSNIKFGFPIFKTDISFFKFFWSFQNNFSLFNKGTFTLSIRNGFASGDMPITERFFAGGIHTYRGAKNDRLGPIDPETLEPTGGNSIIMFNMEATLPLIIIPVNNLYYSVFLDIGNVFPKSSDFSLEHLKKCIGLGIKYKTSLGPLRIDFAWNLGGKPEQNFIIQIGIGNVF